MIEVTDDRPKRELGTVAASELLLRDLYIDLRNKVRAWSSVTRQTPQARMGYVGQHLTSVVTGYPGGRSGARGHDLELPDGKYGEIKTCYRVDQLGGCLTCKAAVSSIEFVCPRCGDDKVVRRDDSKWLIGVRSEAEMRSLFDPFAYYLVLFDFSALEAAKVAEIEDFMSDDGAGAVITDQPLDINARIWQVAPSHPGFALCMVDYRFNIQAHSTSRAPFNLWPYSLKFQLMNPLLIYHAILKADDSIQTLVFPRVLGTPERYPIMPFPAMRGSRRNLSDEKLRRFAAGQGVEAAAGATRPQLLDALETARIDRRWTNEFLATQLAELVYCAGITAYQEWLPEALRTT